MPTYALTIKKNQSIKGIGSCCDDCGDQVNEETEFKEGLVFRTKARSLIEAKEYFRQLKQMDEKSFNKLFIVTEIKDNERKN